MNHISGDKAGRPFAAGYLTVLLICLPLFTLSCGDRNESTSTDETLMGTSNENRQHSETVTGEIQRAVFDIETIKPQLEKAEESRTIHLSLLESVHIHGVLGGSSRAVPGVLTHRYDINEPEVGTMIVSVAGEEVSARIQLDSSGRLFVIRKDHSSDSYVVIEIDPQQLDILEEGEPLQVPGL